MLQIYKKIPLKWSKMQKNCANETFRKASVTIENIKWLKNDYLCSRKT